jgi:hypothetical protein
MHHTLLKGDLSLKGVNKSSAQVPGCMVCVLKVRSVANPPFIHGSERSFAQSGARTAYTMLVARDLGSV